MKNERLEEIRRGATTPGGAIRTGEGGLYAPYGPSAILMRELLAYIDELRKRLAVEDCIREFDRRGSKPRVYIAGPMTGKPDFNFPAFNEAAEALRKAGYEPVNPANHFRGDTMRKHHEYMREAARELATSQGILLLDGWRESKGATFEACVAHVTGMKMMQWAECGVFCEYLADVKHAVVPVVLEDDDAGKYVVQSLTVLGTASLPQGFVTVIESPWLGEAVVSGVRSPGNWEVELLERKPTPKVLILGYTDSGKTTVGKMLCEEFGCAGPCNVGDVLTEWFHDVADARALPPDDRPLYRQAIYGFGRALESLNPTKLVREALEESPIVTGHISEDVLRACVKEGLFDAYVWVARGRGAETDPLSGAQVAAIIPPDLQRYLVNWGTLDDLRAGVASMAQAIREGKD